MEAALGPKDARLYRHADQMSPHLVNESIGVPRRNQNYFEDRSLLPYQYDLARYPISKSQRREHPETSKRGRLSPRRFSYFSYVAERDPLYGNCAEQHHLYTRVRDLVFIYIR